MTAVRERFEHPQAALAARIEHAARRLVALDRFAQTRRALLAGARGPAPVAQSLRDDAAMRFGILANVECREMEAERAHAADQAAHLEHSGVLALVGAQAVDDEVEVAEE